MSYQVLARKWRPASFAEMTGQEHVLRALINALDQQRLHQAYLFTGTRGVGKTTIARILAKALNCEVGVSSQPCGQCSSCQEIDAGRFIDLIEVDAASRTKVEDTRELLDNVQYTPTRGRYKVYLIDEVHMLSTHSFNALLKTLEEPPPHVKFLLATTDPQKLPATILSRCLQFNLKRMPEDLVASRLAEILQSEQIEYDAASLRYLGQAADGSMRDGLSLLDQAIAYGHGKVQAEEVAAMLGFVSRQPIYDLLQALLNRDASALLQAVASLEDMAADYFAVLDDLISVLQQLALAQWVPETLEQEHESPEKLREFSESFGAEDLQLYYQIALIGKRDLPYSPNTKRGLEMILLRMLAFHPSDIEPSTQAGPAVAKAPANPAAAAKAMLNKQAAPPAPASTRQPEPSAAPAPVVATPAKQSETAPSSPPAQASDNTVPSNWHELYQRLNLKGMAAELAANCDLKSWEGDTLVLLLGEKHAQLYNPSFEKRLAEAASGILGKPINIKVEVGMLETETPADTAARHEAEKQASAVESIKQDQVVKALQDKFDAQIQVDSIRPLD